jgi:hypothetical protein
LAAVVDPAFEGDDYMASPYLNDLLSQARERWRMCLYEQDMARA